MTIAIVLSSALSALVLAVALVLPSINSRTVPFGVRVPSRAIQQVREHQQWPWRVFARRLREAVEAGVPTTQLYEITHRFNQYVAQLAARRSTPFRKGAA